ncbi:hypothetical protein SSX86_001565 [Deinandra increscens subsp. villosa]|uniref:Uncharacterized protein n=1 Tax=Deinandra increscens subsp. villosa TaxID=3103831 RepID=A0AAP0DWF3_9ASTR
MMESIPRTYFEFQKRENLHLFEDTKKRYVVDYIGRLGHIQDLIDGDQKPFVRLTLLDASDNPIVLTLWNETIIAPEKFNRAALNSASFPAIVAATMARGHLAIQSYNFTKKTIEELLMLPRNNAVGRTFAVEASITSFKNDHDWFISKCSAASCPRTVMPSGNQWACARDGKIIFPKLLYRVCCNLSDSTSSVPVIMFDEGAKKLTGCDCKDLVMHEGYNDASILPPILLDCRGQQKIFHLRLLLGSQQNVTTFTVENITPVPPLTIAPAVESITPVTPMQPPQTRAATADSMTPITPMQPPQTHATPPLTSTAESMPQTHAAPPLTSTAVKRSLEDALDESGNRVKIQTYKIQRYKIKTLQLRHPHVRYGGGHRDIREYEAVPLQWFPPPSPNINVLVTGHRGNDVIVDVVEAYSSSSFSETSSSLRSRWNDVVNEAIVDIVDKVGLATIDVEDPCARHDVIIALASEATKRKIDDADGLRELFQDVLNLNHPRHHIWLKEIFIYFVDELLSQRGRKGFQWTGMGNQELLDYFGSYVAMSSNRGGGQSNKGKSVVGASSNFDVDQLNQAVQDVSLGSSQDGGWEVISKKNKSKPGNVAATKQWASQATKPNAWGQPDGQRVGARVNAPVRAAQTGGRGGVGAINQPVNIYYENHYIRNPNAIPPPLQSGWNWHSRPGNSWQAGNNVPNPQPVVQEEHVEDEDDDEEIDESNDDELLSDEYDSDEVLKSHEERKKNRWYADFFGTLDTLTLTKSTSQRGSGIAPLARMFLVLLTGESYGQWKGLNDDVKDKEIVWPPMVVIMNTQLEKEEIDKWTGMGNQELLDYFGSYAAVRARHSYGPRGHRGMNVLIFEASAVGYTEAIRLSEHFEDEGTDRSVWEGGPTLFHPGVL